jgi:hypothetical protein
MALREQIVGSLKCRPAVRGPTVKTRTAAGISLAVLGIVVVLLTTVTVYAIPAAILTVALGVLLIVRLNRGEELFPAVAAYRDYQDSMKELESKPGPTCWRCKRQNRLGATLCEGCGASLT